ncbi:MAG TPA: DUF1648 domain-containing protein [Propionibacteriaceae bacterium]
MKRARSWFAGALGVYAAGWLWSWSRLPEQVPIHFGPGGQADQWSSRGSALLFTALLGLGTTAFFVAIAAAAKHGSPFWVNIPNAGYWKQPAQMAQMRRLLIEDLWIFGTWTLLLLSSIQVLTVRAADMPRPTIAPWAPVCLAVYLVGVAAWIWWLYRRRYAVPAVPPA